MDREQDILAALSGIAEMQRTIRTGLDCCVDTGLAFLRIYYQKLPEHVARRLTELPPGVVAAIPGALSPNGTEEARQGIAARVASDAAFAQAVRAANHYRRRLGLGPLGASGRPEEAEGERI